MLIRNVTREEIETALGKTNEDFESNIVFKRLDPAGRTRQGEEKHTVTLTVASSFQPGARRTHTGRRLAAACWHAHGNFMDLLPETAEIVVNASGGRQVIRPGDPWNNWNIGSQAQPMYYSEACDCS